MPRGRCGLNAEEKNAEFARAINEIVRDDVHQVYLRVTGVLGIAVVFVTQLPFNRLVGLPIWTRWVLVIGLACALGSAALYFHYLSKLHLARLQIVRSIRDGKADGAEKIWSGTGVVWDRYGWAFTNGSRLLMAAVLLLGITLLRLLDLIG